MIEHVSISSDSQTDLPHLRRFGELAALRKLSCRQAKIRRVSNFYAWSVGNDDLMRQATAKAKGEVACRAVGKP